MANYSNLLATIAANIYTNGNKKVTAAMVKTAADSIVNTMGPNTAEGVVTSSAELDALVDPGIYFGAAPSYKSVIFFVNDYGTFISQARISLTSGKSVVFQIRTSTDGGSTWSAWSSPYANFDGKVGTSAELDALLTAGCYVGDAPTYKGVLFVVGVNGSQITQGRFTTTLSGQVLIQRRISTDNGSTWGSWGAISSTFDGEIGTAAQLDALVTDGVYRGVAPTYTSAVFLVHDYGTFIMQARFTTTSYGSAEIQRRITTDWGSTWSSWETADADITICGDDFRVISQYKTELLACGGVSVKTDSRGNIATAYGYDDTQANESESEDTIGTRVSLWNICNPLDNRIVHIAKAGDAPGGYPIGPNAPYEPNVVPVSDTKSIVLFNCYGGGVYHYACCEVDTENGTAANYQDVKLEGATLTQDQALAVYNTLTGRGQLIRPTLVMTSVPVYRSGYWYSFLGGIATGWMGMLVRTTDGINWEAVASPSVYPGVDGIIEAGIAFYNSKVYIIMRSIASGVYHCVLNESDFSEAVATSEVTGVTTSKPIAFVCNNTLYAAENSTAQYGNRLRSILNVYRVDIDTADLSPIGTIQCKGGISYPAPLVFGEHTFISFQTDTREVSPATRTGRSEIGVVKLV